MIIYKAENLINGRIYIGMTTKTLEQKIRVHNKSCKHSNSYFNKELREFGVDQFEWSILATAQSLEELERLKAHYIKEYNTFDNPTTGYNQTNGYGEGSSISTSVLDHLREINIGENNPMYGVASKYKGSNNPISRPVINKTTREVFGSVNEAAREVGSDTKSIRRACQHTGYTCRGYEWSYWEIWSKEDYS